MHLVVAGVLICGKMGEAVFVFLQVPLAILTSVPMMEGQLGNVVVWVSIVLGQPLAILMYMHDYYLMHYGPLNETLTAT